MTEDIQRDQTLNWKVKVVDRFMDSFDVIVLKFTSGRFLAVTFDTIGYTVGVVITGVLAFKKIIDPGIFIAVLGTYAVLVQRTRESYFNMGKEKTNGGENEKVKSNGAGPNASFAGNSPNS